MNPGTVVCAVPSALGSSAEDSGLYSVFLKENKFDDHRSVITMRSNEGYRIAKRQNATVT